MKGRRTSLLSAVIVLLGISYAKTASGENLIYNGDFEQGAVGFNTGYVYNSTAFPEGTYSICTNPRNIHPFFADYQDHTTGSGNMLVANGALNPGVAVWEQTVSVSPDTNYEFSFWVSTANEYEPLIDINPADLEYFINGVSLGIVSPPFQYGVWIQESNFWYSGTSTTATIKIVDTDTNYWGNDFALDDIRFVPEPATILLLSFGGLALRGFGKLTTGRKR